MTHAYDEILLERASDSLGRMLDFAAHSLRRDVPAMMDLFCASGLAGLFERGDIRVIAGMSGMELAYETLELSGLTYERIPPRHTKSLRGEYWCGHVLARIQWETCLPFDRIMKTFSASAFIAGYGRQRTGFLSGLPLGISEAERAESLRVFGMDLASDAVRTFLRDAENAARKETGDTPLKTMRRNIGLSQSQLAKTSGIPVRTIQQYEQRQKDIRKARAEYLIALSRVLGCDPSYLLYPADHPNEKKQG